MESGEWRKEEEGAKRVNKRKKGRWCSQRDRCEKQSPAYLIDEAVGHASYLYRRVAVMQIRRDEKE